MKFKNKTEHEHYSTMANDLSQPMPKQISRYRSWLLLIASLVWSIASYTTGYQLGQSRQICNPFQLIKDMPESPYPSIDDLLKKAH